MTTTALPAQTFTPTRRRFTVEEYCAMAEAGILAEDERVELLDGEIFVMPPIGPPHEDGTTRLSRDLILRLGDRAWVRVQNSVRLNDYGLPEPDIAVVRFRDDYHRNRPTPADVLLVIEVADSSLRRDRELKLPHYAAAGIPEFWIPNVPARHVEAFSDPVDGVYQSRRTIPADGQISPIAFPDVVLTVGEFLLGDPGSEGDETGTLGTDS
ncbi:MAG: Uma2 family endonuclease [Chloroflexota bacterium]|nr:Uma2 family endonuclease [Chloroflexota bacterium]MDE2959670.1 Uma2 family endonuclease [Chloroflexota bacterium]